MNVDNQVYSTFVEAVGDAFLLAAIPEEVAKLFMLCIGWNVPDAKGTMFVWAPLPDKFTSSVQFVEELMEKTGIIATPGVSFGSLGEGYVRFALVHPVTTIQEVVRLIDESGILR